MKGLWWGVSLLLALVVWASGSSAAPLGLSLPRPLDWLGHLLGYLALGYALGRATGRRGLSLVWAVWFGAADEVHQAFVAGRESGLQDWLGALLGAWLGLRLALPPNRRAGEARGEQDGPEGRALRPGRLP